MKNIFLHTEHTATAAAAAAAAAQYCAYTVRYHHVDVDTDHVRLRPSRLCIVDVDVHGCDIRRVAINNVLTVYCV